MSKVLIASIGTGNFSAKTRQPEYRKANYYIDGDESVTYTTPYITEAMKHFYDIDKIIFIGTCGSDWYSLYTYITGPDQRLLSPPAAPDNDYSYRLLELFLRNQKYNLEPDAVSPLLNPLKDALGSMCLDIILLRYGLNETELMENFDKLCHVCNLLEEGDSVYFDITHSFRSLPIYELLVINYIKDALNKNINIEMVSYGMLDITGEMGGKTPIVNMRALTDTLEYIKAADEYRRFGTAFSLTEILLKTKDIELTGREKMAFNLINDAISANNIGDFKKLIQWCHKIVGKDGGVSGEGAFKILSDAIFSDLDKRFYNKLNDENELQFEFAMWHYEKKRYIACAITLAETIVSLSIEICGGNKTCRAERDFMRKKLRSMSSKPVIGEFLDLYGNLADIRNIVAHLLDTANQREKLEELRDQADKFVILYNKHLKNTANHSVRKNREALKYELRDL